MKKAFLCLSSDLYYPQFQVLVDSIFTHHPEGYDVVLLYFGAGREHDPRIRVLTPDQVLKSPNTSYPEADFIASHRAALVSWALHEYDKVMLLGADCRLYAPVDDFFHKLDNHPIILTPHITNFLPDDDKFPRYEEFFYCGQMNVDVLGFKRTDDVQMFLRGIHDLLQKHCVRDKSRFIFSDQTWFNLAFSMIDNVLCLRDYEYNMGYWNCHDRELQFVNGCFRTWTGIPLKIFQFSGMNFDNPAIMSIHQNRYRAEGDILRIFEEYAKEVKCQER